MNSLALCNTGAAKEATGTRPMTEIESRMDSMEISTKRLFESIDRLRNKLDSTLTSEYPSAPCGEEAVKTPERCALSEQILGQEQSIRSATAMIENLIERCQL